MLLIRRPTGKKSNALPTAHQPCIWCLDGGRNMLVTSSQHARHKLVTLLATCTLCHGRRGAQHGKSVRNMGKCVRIVEKVFATRCWMLVPTCSPQTCNMFATNSQHRLQHVHYVKGGGRGRNMEKVFATWENVFATWKKCLQHGKRCSQHSQQHASQHHDPTADMSSWFESCG
jgi:hypothetical protein